MITIESIVKSACDTAIHEAFPELGNYVSEVVISKPGFGDYQCNSAMKLAKELKLNPRAVGEKILACLDQKGELFQKKELAGPGFINLFLKESLLESRLDALVQDSRLGVQKETPPKKVIVEFSSPNTAKEMHVGHLRSTIIGESLARLFEFLGDTVLRLNHVGDWGTQFGMLIAYLKDKHPEVLDHPDSCDLASLMKWYKESKVLFDQDPAFKKTAQEQVVKLQGGDPMTLAAWEKICEISRRGYEEIYKLLDVTITERGESFYNTWLKDVVQELESKGLVTVSDGAKCVFMPEFINREGQPLPLMIQKSDGGYNYDTTDMAAIRHRIFDEKADRIIYITDAGQALHFALVFKAAEYAGWFDPLKLRIDHVPFGLVLGPDGKKFKTRSGDTEKLIDLLFHAVEKSKHIVDERNKDWPEEKKQALAKTLGLSAVKYADLSCHRVGDYQFSYERMLRFDGNTALFLLYAYVRVNGIKRHLGSDIEKLKENGHIHLGHPSERDLALKLVQFPDVLRLMADDLLPHRLAEYLYELANAFNAFFRDCRVAGSEEESSRLLLADLTARTLKQGLWILGIPTVDEM